MGEAVYELPAIAGIYVLIGILFVVAYTFTLLAHALNISVFGTHPFSGLANTIENTIVNGCKDGIDALEHYAVGFESGLIDTFGILLGVFLLPLLGIRAALSYLWGSLVRPLVNDATGAVRPVASEALSEVKRLEKSVTGDVARLDHSIATATTDAEHVAHSFTVQEVNALEHTLHSEIVAVRDAIPQQIRDAANATDLFIWRTVDTLRNAENAAIQGVSNAEGKTADELHALVGRLDLTELTALIGSVPLLATLVHTIAAEAGLDNAECRGKVKEICSTDANLWGNLLGGLAAMTVAFNLRELIEFGNDIVHDLTPLIREIET